MTLYFPGYKNLEPVLGFETAVITVPATPAVCRSANATEVLPLLNATLQCATGFPPHGLAPRALESFLLLPTFCSSAPYRPVD